MSEDISERLIRHIENWRSKLIDLSQRNRLLHYKRSGSLKFIAPDTSTIFKSLVQDSSVLKIWQFPPIKKHEQDEQAVLLEVAASGPTDSEKEQTKSAASQLEEALLHKPLKENEILADKADEKDLMKTLIKLHRKYHTEYTEKGISTLYVAFGILEWKENENSFKSLSPLVLCPVSMSRKSVADGYKIELGDDDIAVNPALREKLKRDFGLELPALPEELTANDLAHYLRQIQDEVEKLGWKVHNSAEMSIFSFHKIAMYNELKDKRELIAKHPLVQLMAGVKSADDFTDGSSVTEEELDQITDASRLFHVLDADSSQQMCIEEALKGKSFVIEGPPGTGKSQTIANIICEFIESGKKVLFVSEKMAALEVVHNRLKKVGLDFCSMELHSHKANKKEVIEELSKCLTEQAVGDGAQISRNKERLLQLRDKLRDHIEALHQKREPIDLSAFEIISRLSALEDLPFIPCDIADIRQLTLGKINRFEDVFAKTIHVWDVVKAGDSFPWCGCGLKEFNIELKMKIEGDLKRVGKKIEETAQAFLNLKNELRITFDITLADGEWLVPLLKHLEKGHSVPREWVSELNPSDLMKCAEYWEGESRAYAAGSASLDRDYQPGFYGLPENKREELVEARKVIANLVQGNATAMTFPGRAQDLIGFAKDSARYFEKWFREITDLLIPLGLTPSIVSLSFIQQVSGGFLDLFQRRLPQKIWFDGHEVNFVTRFLTKYAAEFPKLKDIRRDLEDKYTEKIFDSKLEGLCVSFQPKGEFRKWYRCFNPRYKKAIKELQAISRVKLRKDVEIYNDLVNAKRISTVDHELMTDQQDIESVLGSIYSKYDTDMEQIKNDLVFSEAAKKFLLEVGLEVGKVNVSKLVDFFCQSDAKNILSTILSEMHEWQSTVYKHRLVLSIDSIPQLKGVMENKDVKAGLDWFLLFSEKLGSLSAAVAPILDVQRQKTEVDLELLLKHLNELEKRRAFEKKLIENTPQLKKEFLDRFQGKATNWGEILRELKWVRELKALVRDGANALEFLGVLSSPEKISTKGENIENLCASIKRGLDDINGYFDEKYSISEGESFKGMSSRIKNLESNIELLQGWVEFIQAMDEIAAVDGEIFLQRIVEGNVEPSEIKDVVRKSLWQTFLNRLVSEDKKLANFKSEHHEDVLAEYQRLDEELNQLSRNLVIASANRLHPGAASCSGSQVSTLRFEAAKQRRQKPLRKLFAEIPELILSLKRCFLMSPLSVTHFLDPQKYQFDLVVFDEASQIFPEDTISAIARGRQVIVVGDRKQLPPTSFFKETDIDEEEDDENAEQQMEDLPSILDACWALGLEAKLLRWHYRSRHEDLITFSNRLFYENKLITFPSSRQKHEDLGVKFEYVSGGVYERGGRKINMMEAEKVADLVLAHYKKHPKKTIGVVALSLSQRDAIETFIELKLKGTPYYEKVINQDRLDGFFIKNLESVQGDERDVMIISIGYAKDQNGRLSMNFGPLNRGEGWRRLNVLITRARDKCIVVSSIRGSEIASNVESVKCLQRFLNYSENGLKTLDDLVLNRGAEPESPFEESVAYAIEKMGYDVVLQVGCSGFRIDIGVIDSDNPGSCMLGIECDGATYHSIKATRDRDRLRQMVLEGMGWKIHRIWSLDWMYSRDKEEKRLKEVLEKCKNGIFQTRLPRIPENLINVNPVEKIITDDNNKLHLPGAKTYSPYIPYAARSMGDFHSPNAAEKIRAVMCEIIDNDICIHVDALNRRILEIWGIARMGARVERQLQTVLRHIFRWDKDRYEKKADFCYRLERKIQARKCDSTEPESFRDINEIAPEEIREAICLIVETVLGVSEDGLIKSVASFFGLQRTTEEAANLIRGNLKDLVGWDVLTSREGQIVLNKTR